MTFKLKNDWNVSLSAAPNELSLENNKDFDQKTGYITAFAPGSTKLLISAEHGKKAYSGECAINIIDDNAVEYEGIK